MSAFQRAGEVMKKMDDFAKEEPTEENRFKALDVVKEASDVLDELTDPIASQMIRERIGKLQTAMGWQ